MNARKFNVVLVIGVLCLCAIVTARPLEEISKDTSISSTNKATTIGIGVEKQPIGALPLSCSERDGDRCSAGFEIEIEVDRSDIVLCCNIASALVGTSESLTVSDPNPAANSTSASFGQGAIGAAARQDGATAGGSGFEGSN